MALGPDDVRLSDRIALVTGAAVGIGAAIAETYARFGADLALCDRNADALGETAERVRKEGRRVHAAVLDVRDADAVDRFVSDLGAAWGHIDVLVNNAGGTFHAPFLEVSARGQDALVHENFTSVTNFVRAVAPRMPAGSGSIVNLTSIEAHRAGPGYAVYSAMKAAVENLTKSLALELGARGIRVNCIAPDVIPTPGIGVDLPMSTPLPRRGDVDDVAAAAVYLASDLGRFVTGTTIHVDGGNLAAGGWKRADDGSFTT
jgi:3-oxoacyl-[acyl-carrier protein] reductase